MTEPCFSTVDLSAASSDIFDILLKMKRKKGAGDGRLDLTFARRGIVSSSLRAAAFEPGCDCGGR